MKIIKVFGIVAGLHALALILIFANPGCSSTGAQTPKPSDTAPKNGPAGSVDAPPITAVPAADAGTGGPPITPVADTSITVPGIYSPTRPGTPAASALEAKPVEGVIPATTYVVVRGDSLWAIAKKKNLKVSELAAANGLRSDATLRLGQKLIIPGANPAGSAEAAPTPQAAPGGAPAADTAKKASAETLRHQVKPGETLGAIAHAYGVKVGDLAKANNIADPQKIRPGQELVIPPGGHAPASRGSQAEGSPAPKAAPAAPPPATTPAPVIPGPDPGAKPAGGEDIPVIKIDDASSQPAPPKQP